MTLRVLVWDPLETGHHPTWLRILVETAPPAVTLNVPDWFLGTTRGTNVYRLSSPDQPFSSITRALEQNPSGVLLLPDLRPILSSSALWRRTGAARTIAIDHGSDHVRLIEEPTGSLRPKEMASASRELIRREILVRRQPIRIFSTNPDSPRLGSRRLRSATHHLPMPIEKILNVESSRWPRFGRRLVLVGALQPRKGLAALVEALELIDTHIDKRDLEIVIAGRPSQSYRPQVERFVARLNERGFRARFVGRYLGDDEYSALIDTADVVALPYDRFIGGSGIVGSLIGRSTSLVISDYGWLGRFAAERGAYTYPNGDIAGLADALERALSERRALLPGGRGYLPETEAMSGLWEAVLALSTR